MATFHKAAKVSALRPNEGHLVEVGGKALALFLIEGQYYCIDNVCLHRGGPLAEGFVDGTIVTCPWHAWQYDLTTGQSRTNPAAKLATYEVKIEGDDVLVGV